MWMPDVPLYAAQRVEGFWRVIAPDPDPCAPPVRVVAAVSEPAKTMRSGVVKPFGQPYDPAKRFHRADFDNADWREQLLELAHLVDLLQPDHGSEAFHLRKLLVARGLRRLAARRYAT
jgi:hypothetical protein